MNDRAYVVVKSQLYMRLSYAVGSSGRSFRYVGRFGIDQYNRIDFARRYCVTESCPSCHIILPTIAYSILPLRHHTKNQQPKKTSHHLCFSNFPFPPAFASPIRLTPPDFASRRDTGFNDRIPVSHDLILRGKTLMVLQSSPLFLSLTTSCFA